MIRLGRKLKLRKDKIMKCECGAHACKDMTHADYCPCHPNNKPEDISSDAWSDNIPDVIVSGEKNYPTEYKVEFLKLISDDEEWCKKNQQYDGRNISTIR